MQVILSFLILTLMVSALVSIITTDSSLVKFLPKFAWIIITILLPLIGSILWFVLGRERSESSPMPSLQDMFPRRERRTPQRPAAPYTPPAPQGPSTEEQIAALEREIEYYENEERIRHMQAEIDKKRGAEGDKPDPAGS